MSLLKTGTVQVGQSGAASNNFHWRNLLACLLRLSRGNAGAPITDAMRPLTVDELEAHLNPPPTPEQVQAQANAEARTYLASTDWYVICKQETGQEIPADILATRAEARSKVIEV